jgi:pyruvate,water dikinase
VTPDTFVVGKRGFEVTMREIAVKSRMTVMTDDGTAEVDVPQELQEKSSLEEDHLRAMTELAVKLERAVGHAVDIECAIADETLYLLQCRPITTLG